MIFLETGTRLSAKFVRIVGLLTITGRVRWNGIDNLKIVRASDGSVERRELQKEKHKKEQKYNNNEKKKKKKKNWISLQEVNFK